MSTREQSIEDHLVECVNRSGGLVIKLVPKGLRGIPDRIIVMPGGRVAFVELKRPHGGVIATLQHWWRSRILGLGVEHHFINTREGVRALVGESHD